jgi:hypothetical protein
MRTEFDVIENLEFFFGTFKKLRGVWFEKLKFNKYCSTFVLFDKKILILD